MCKLLVFGRPMCKYLYMIETYTLAIILESPDLNPSLCFKVGIPEDLARILEKITIRRARFVCEKSFNIAGIDLKRPPNQKLLDYEVKK